MKTQIELLSEWVEQFSIGTVPGYTLEQAKLQVLDCVASISAGFRCAPGQKIYSALKEFSSSEGDHCILPTGESWSLENAVYLHASLINTLELDNFCYMGHLSESAFPVALAITEKTKSSNEAFLESLICAQEVSGRLGAYLASGPLQGHMRSFIHRIGAAVAAVKLYNCPSKIVANAIAISLSSPELPMFPTSFSPETKITCVSSATVEGMRSAFLAMKGFEASLDIIEHPAGFVKNFSRLNHIPDFWKSLGKTWTMDAISFKYYSSCGYSQGPVNAVLNAIESKNISSKEISAIHLHSPILTVVMEEFSIPHYQSGLNQVNINFSTKRSVSAAILYRGLDGSFFANHNDEMYHEEIINLSKKVFIHHSWKHTIEMIMGMDACLENAGYPGVFDTGTSDKTLNHLKKVYKNRTLFELSELKEFLSLPKGYLPYLIKRVLKSYAGKKGLSRLKSFETDLSKLQFRAGTSAEIHFNTGEILNGECDVPKGFAGDPGKKYRVIEKFERECSPVYGAEKTAILMNEILAGGFPKL
ncbi:MAG: MmgE/PrpD family protein [Sphingobacteriales bacterium]